MADNQFSGLEVSTFDELFALIDGIQEHSAKVYKRVVEELYGAVGKVTKKLAKTLRSMGTLVEEAFRVDSLESYTAASRVYGQELAGILYRLQLSFSQLQGAVIYAAMPVAQVLVPAVTGAVNVLSNLVTTLGSVLRTLLLGSDSAEGFSQAVTAIGTAGKSLSRTVTGFDQLNRLGKKSTASGGILSVPSVKPLTGVWKDLSDSILSFLQPLQKIDLTPVSNALQQLHTAMLPFTQTLFDGLHWAWENIFVPIAQWTVEELLPVFLNTLKTSLEALGRVVETLKPVFSWLWENFLKPLGQWAGDQIIGYLEELTYQLTGVSGWAQENQGPVERMISAGQQLAKLIAGLVTGTIGWSNVTESASNGLNKLLLAMAASLNPMAGTNSALGGLIATVGRLAESFGLVDIASGNTWNGLKQVWENAWSILKEKTVDPTYSGVKDMINRVITVINGLLRGITSALNYLSQSMNQMGVELPDWIPLVGGKKVSFPVQHFTAPQIPYLARGAVLPANKPFLAMVGDQRHGTNIEAPLATIQEAVAVVMEDMVQSNVAGHQATVSVLGQILQAVLGISIGDDVIAAAVERHNRKMAIAWGGY